MKTKHLTAKEIEAVEKAAEFWAEYFGSTKEEAIACHHMTIDCMVKFANLRVEEIPSELATDPDISNHLCDKYSLTIDYAPILEEAYELGCKSVAKKEAPSESTISTINGILARECDTYCDEHLYNVATKIANLPRIRANSSKICKVNEELFAFAEWTSLNDYTAYDDHTWKKRTGLYDFDSDPIYITTEQLFEEFQTAKNQNQ